MSNWAKGLSSLWFASFVKTLANRSSVGLLLFFVAPSVVIQHTTSVGRLPSWLILCLSDTSEDFSYFLSQFSQRINFNKIYLKTECFCGLIQSYSHHMPSKFSWVLFLITYSCHKISKKSGLFSRHTIVLCEFWLKRKKLNKHIHI